MKHLCPNKILCGSCSLSDIPYKNQLASKLNEINSFLKAENLNVKINHFISSTITTHYRNRMDYAISYLGEVGLKQKGKWWKIIDGHTCFIADDKIEKLFHEFRRWIKNTTLSFYDRKSHRGLLRYVVIRSSTLGETMVTLITNKPEDKKEEDTLLLEMDIFKKNSTPTALIWGVNSSLADTSSYQNAVSLTKKDFIVEKINSFYYKISPNSFFQTNPYTAALLQKYVNTSLADGEYKKLLDLYCGSGFFTIGAGNYVPEIIGVEIENNAISDAVWNVKNNKTKNVRFVCNPSENIDVHMYDPDIIIVDPPRAGLSKRVIENIKTSNARTIIYISCNYKTYTLNLKQLAQKYSIKDIVAVDMFPHTPHVEIASILTK